MVNANISQVSLTFCLPLHLQQYRKPSKLCCGFSSFPGFCMWDGITDKRCWTFNDRDAQKVFSIDQIMDL